MRVLCPHVCFQYANPMKMAVSEFPRVSVCVCLSACLWCGGVPLGPQMCVCIGICMFLFSFAICKRGCPSVSRVCLCAQKPRLSLLWVPEEGVGKGCVCIWMCRCVCGQRQGYIRTHRAAANVHTVFTKASHLFSWFCFSPPCGLWTLLAHKGSLKNAALPVFPNVQNAAVNLNGASSDIPPCRCCRKPPASRATNTHLHNMTGRVGRKGSHPTHCRPTPELAGGPTWELRAHVGV